MNHLSIEKLTKSYNEKTLFTDITFGIEQGQKVALVGVNGCGKSTLLKIIAGVETPGRGDVSFMRDLNVAYLDQSPELPTAQTINDVIFNSKEPAALVLKDYHKLSSKSELNPKEQVQLQKLLEQIDALNAWDYEYRAKEILGRLGIHNLELLVSNLSGGQKKRVALASVLVSSPDFLILDEPTNHLDLDIIEWLEEYLSTQTLTLLMVTHDRYFLDKVTSDIIEIENGKLYKYKGNYSAYLEKKANRDEIAQKTKDKAKNLMRKELEWMRRQPKARGTKAKYRIEAFGELKEKSSVNLQRAELEIKTKESRMGKKILELKHLSKSFDDKVIFKDFNHVFTKDEKVGVIGENGAGKSTFLNILTGSLAASDGIIDAGINTKFGYYTQTEIKFNETQKVIDVVNDVAEVIELADGKSVTASQFLNMFLFPPATQHDFISKLSGGEKRRLQLLRVLISNPNFLILDEPTNDLDIITLNILEEYLRNFSGCLLLVSHDRYFMDRLVDHLLVFNETPEIKHFPGNYTDYRLTRDDLKEVTNEASAQEKSEKVKLSDKKKPGYKEQREFETLEKSIPELEKQKQGLVEKLNSGLTDHIELEKLSKQLEALSEELEDMEMRWLELSEVM
ncbi:MAG: ABC-F family ATP-binding cassette domain-containing protein [Bacteroidetes bacterium]|nr:ABC-F family ATP-binding cassette domain-containing protein [Bacteroidota bacterium]MDA1122468.1 ABC-F family ATP-binding cassette domain-containing protein [Bacteroidota bacterium]